MTTKHHLIPVSRGWTDHQDNIVRLTSKEHQNFHNLFWNKTPREQFDYLFHLNYKVLSDQVKSDILYILTLQDYKDWYKKHTFKR